jgi:hypothetical protein
VIIGGIGKIRNRNKNIVKYRINSKIEILEKMPFKNVLLMLF